MKIQLGNKYKFYLPDIQDVDKRLCDVNELLKTEVQFDDLQCTVEEYLRITWDKNNTRIVLDRIGYYLSKKPNQDGTHDKEMLSKNEEIEMISGFYKGEKRYTNFTNLDEENKILFGFKENNK